MPTPLTLLGTKVGKAATRLQTPTLRDDSAHFCVPAGQARHLALLQDTRRIA
jgi:hypothetical protein